MHFFVTTCKYNVHIIFCFFFFFFTNQIQALPKSAKIINLHPKTAAL